jgi:hypothetical protein
MMPREKSNEDVISRRKAAVAKRTSTTNWSDIWVNADNFPEVSAPGVKEKYTLPPVGDLNASQLKMVGWTDQVIDQM